VTAGAGLVSMMGAPAEAAPSGRHPANPRMVLGTQRRAVTREALQEFKRHGVARVCGYPVDPPCDQETGDRGYWLESDVAAEKERIEGQGMEMDVVALPFPESSLIDNDQENIVACAKAGVGTIKYNMSILGVLTTGEVTGRADYANGRRSRGRGGDPGASG